MENPEFFTWVIGTIKISYNPLSSHHGFPCKFLFIFASIDYSYTPYLKDKKEVTSGTLYTRGVTWTASNSCSWMVQCLFQNRRWIQNSELPHVAAKSKLPHNTALWNFNETNISYSFYGTIWLKHPQQHCTEHGEAVVRLVNSNSGEYDEDEEYYLCDNPAMMSCELR